jgi:hypothetical protein
MTLSITTLSMKGLFWIFVVTYHNGVQNIDIQHNDTQHNDTQLNKAAIMLNVFM